MSDKDASDPGQFKSTAAAEAPKKLGDGPSPYFVKDSNYSRDLRCGKQRSRDL